MNEAERKENKLPRIYDIPISEIDDFPDHPFKVKIDEDMDQLVQSIKERGIITPVTLRPQDTDESKTVQTEASSPKQTVPDTKVEEKKSPSTKDETTSSQAETSSTSTKDQPKPTEAKPREQEKPKETEATKKEEQPKQQEQPKPVETKASFDINYWISFAKEAAVSKGLTLDSSAVDCWDNPITANPDCIYLERDINSRLNRYAGDEDITDVWIWYECVGENSYLIYIGYA
mgnify:CR=1 FL=1